jgi:signal transduction histidine kinase
MPQRATSHALAYGGVALVLLSGVLIVGPVLWGRPDLANRLVANSADLDQAARSDIRTRDVIDTLRETRVAERGYLLTGSQQERAAYYNLAQVARKSIADLHATAADWGSWPKFDTMTDGMLADLARGAALQDAGRHDDAVIASNIGGSRELIAEIDDITRERISALRKRYLVTVDEIRTDSDRSDQSASVMFALAGAAFALGCIALVAYLWRHLTAAGELRAGRDAALEASAIKTRFVATASHDLRQPLHAISMFVGVLRRRSQDPAVLEVVENVATAVGSMQRMFAALLDVARLDAGAVKVERRSFALHDMFHALGVEFVASAATKGLSLQIQPTPFSVEADPALVETILRNLLSNAVKFTDRGVVGMTTRRCGTAVEIIVFDTGIGIAAKDHTAIFGQFERLGPSGGSREGLGLGLSIVERMADLIGVAVAVESQLGNGSRFTLSLPYADPVQGAVYEPSMPAAELRGYRILVLDDHPEARKAIALAVETLGAVPLEAASPEAALSLLAGMAPETPHAAVIDHDLGGEQTGPEFLAAYAVRSGKALPAVIVTGATEARTLAILAAAGRPWLIKPVDLDVLRLTLSQLIKPVAVV